MCRSAMYVLLLLLILCQTAVTNALEWPCALNRGLRALRGDLSLATGLSKGPSPTPLNATCALFGDCDSCVGMGYFDNTDDFVTCVWCTADSGGNVCMPSVDISTLCPLDSNQYTSCDTSYYTYICIVILSALLCLCMCTCYLRRYRPEDSMAPMLPSAARHFLWRNSFDKEGRKDWMCIICGFDNKTANSSCSICGTSFQFSSSYKAGKREQQNNNVRADAYKFDNDNDDTVTSSMSPLRGPADALQGSDTWRDVDARQVARQAIAGSSAGAGVGAGADRTLSSGSAGSVAFSRTASRTGNSLSDTQLEPPALMSPMRTSRADREEAFHYRRLNQLSLRQKAGRRRRMWQRVRDEQTGGLVWTRAPPQKTKVSEAAMGYTPRASFDGGAAVAAAAGERNMASTNRFANKKKNDWSVFSFLTFGVFDGQPTSSSPRAAAPIATSVPAEEEAGEGWLVARAAGDGLAMPRGAMGHAQLSGRGNGDLREALLGAVEDGRDSASTRPVDISKARPIAIGSGGERSVSTDSFGDSTLMSGSPGYTTVFSQEEGLRWERVVPGIPVSKTVAPPPKKPSQPDTVSAIGPPLYSAPALQPDRLVRSLLDELETVDLIAINAQSFKEKQLWFLDQMGKLQKQWAEGCIRMELDRHHILRDSRTTFGSVETGELHKWIRVQFAGEPGVDAGGLEREWFTLIVAELFDPANGLFTCSSAESLGGAYHINPTSDRTNPEEHLELFALAGRVIGKAIMEQQAIAATLSLPLRKQILNLPITFSDLEFVDPVFYHNLKFLETFEDIESLSLDFTVSYPVVRRDETTNCNPVVFDLKPGGSNVAVTNENRDEYLQLLLANRMLTSVKSQVEYLLGGLYEVIPPDILSIFDYQELELLLCGVPDIDVKDWSTYTEYMGGYNLLGRKHKVIQWFWAFVEGCDNEEKAHLLQFITGCSRVPAQGFKALVSNDGKLRKFNIQSINKKDSIYPRSHTCFNKLDLPMYDSQAELDAYMSCVTNGDVFGFTIE